MKQLLRCMYDHLTYRNEYTDPDPADGLQVSDRRGRRTVHHPHLPAFLEARRRRILRDGLAPIDWALMDPDTARLLLLTQAELMSEPTRRKRPASRQLAAIIPSPPSGRFRCPHAQCLAARDSQAEMQRHALEPHPRTEVRPAPAKEKAGRPSSAGHRQALADHGRNWTAS